MTIIRREFDEFGDYKIGTFVDQSAATVQAVYTRLREFKGEWYLNELDGTAWFQKILVKPPNLPVAEAEIKSRIVQTDGVKELLSFEMTFNNETRELLVEFSAKTIWGDEIYQVIGL